MASKRLIVPEVVQTSAMDCGPACLSSLLQGFDIRVSYERLREACQTDVDGTSIDTLEEVAIQLELEAEQIMVPIEYVLAQEPEPLPAIAVVRLPNNNTHFVVVWSRINGLMQIMDPAVGRVWRGENQFLSSLYVHRMAVPVSVWQEWAHSEAFLAPLRSKMSRLGCRRREIDELVSTALAKPGWRALAAIEAATRTLEHMLRAHAFRRGTEASRALQHFVKTSNEGPASTIPPEYWSLQPVAGEATDEVIIRGVVLVRVKGRRPEPTKLYPGAHPDPERNLSPELNAALMEPVVRPARLLLRSIWQKSPRLVTVTMAALLVSATGALVEVVLLRGLLDIFVNFNLAGERLAVVATIASFLLALLLLDYSIAASVLRLGRLLESKFRLTFFRCLPHIADLYFRSRLSSDMAQRSHSTHRLRTLPAICGQLVRTIAELVITAAGIIWLDRSLLALTVGAAGLSLGLPLLFNPALRERDLRVRNHVGALTRFYLDAMLGLTPLRAHCAQRPLRREHDAVLREWAGSVLSLQRAAVLMDTFQLLVGFGFAVLLLGKSVIGPQAGAALLLMYWALKIPMLSQSLALSVRQLPSQINVALRVLEPLGARLDLADSEAAPGKAGADTGGHGIRVTFHAVKVHAAGHVILEGINLNVPPGAHVAIVGPSGAGKSSLVGLLLGLHTPGSGKVLVNGSELTPATLEVLRRQTAWIDPAVQLWNRSLFENLRYGSATGLPDSSLIEQADLLELLTTLPEGLQTNLGESGAIVSGGEGQRVRLGRAMLKQSVRLVVMDEPFRGLERQKRHALLANARAHWKSATMFCVTHDISETVAFDRVLVVESGHIVEDGSPVELLQKAGTRFRSLVEAEAGLCQSLWSGDRWRRLWLEAGRLTEREHRSSPPPGARHEA